MIKKEKWEILRQKERKKEKGKFWKSEKERKKERKNQ